ncbi:hypothetical protein JW868_04855 [Candidatus Woesearchaeota archaeon]|nr:hypothetical protein [Candidatus Woesearchaeota archaeon]
MAITKKKLERKGWSKKEIHHTLRILEKAKKSPHRNRQHEVLAYIIAIIMGVISNVFVAAFLIPLIVLSAVSPYSTWLLGSITAFLGLVFGILYSVLIRDLDHLEKKHHISAIFLIPLLGFISFLLIAGKTSQISNAIASAKNINPTTFAFTYIIFFLIPYAIVLFNKGFDN